MPGTPLTDDQRAEVERLARTGLSQAAVARESGVSRASVARICSAAGITFDRTITAAATAAKQADNRARRAALVQRLYGRTEAVMDRLEAEAYEYTVVVAGQGVQSVTDEYPPAQDERALSSAVGGYLTAAAKLEAVDAEGQATGVRSMLGDLAAALLVTPAE
jgi:transcriptional regulator with XRE-family HTH domain